MTKCIVTFAAFMLLSGCRSPAVILHPISTLDIQYMPAGQAYTPAKDGYFLSKEYLSEVAEAKVE